MTVLQNYISGLDHIALQLSNLEEGLHFFQDLLGFKTKFQTAFKGQKLVMLNAGKVELEMWEDTSEVVAKPAPHGVHHIAVKVRKLDEVMAEIRRAGVDVLTDIYAPTRGIREAIVRGPDDIRVQLVEQNVLLLIWRAVTGDFK